MEREQGCSYCLERCITSQKLTIFSFWNFPFNICRLQGTVLSEIQKVRPPGEAGQQEMRAENLGLYVGICLRDMKNRTRPVAYILLGLEHREQLLMTEVPALYQGDP